MVPYRIGTGGTEGHNAFSLFENLQEMEGKPSCPLRMAGIQPGLAAAGLKLRKIHLNPQGFQDPYARACCRGEQKIGRACEQQGYFHVLSISNQQVLFAEGLVFPQFLYDTMKANHTVIDDVGQIT
jgi:hypothetical protein